MGLALPAAIGGAGAGAATGSLLGPVGTAAGGVLGGLGGLLFGMDADAAAKEKLRALHEMTLAYQAARPEYAQSRVNALGQTLKAYDPMNRFAGAVAGPDAMIDMQGIAQNPLTPGTQNPGVGTIASLQSEIDRRREAEATKKRGF